MNLHTLELLVFFSLCLVLMRTTENANVSCLERERLALLRFKQDLVDRSNVLSSWGSEEYKKECCEWKGISCSNRTGHVIALQLNVAEDNSYLMLTGKLSPALLELRHLTVLDLSHNYFEDKQIPRFIGSLTRLKHLNLGLCDLYDVVHDQLRNLTDLETLDLGFNVGLEFNKLDWLPHLSSLTRLDLSWSNLSDPRSVQEIMKLPSITELYLGGCDVPEMTTSSLINASFMSSSLSVLDLHGIGLTSRAFGWLFNMSANLVSLDLSINHIEGPIPESFGNLIFLEYLDLSDNMFQGAIPNSLWDLSNLRKLFLYSNDFREPFSTVVQNLPKEGNVSLESLDMSYNQMTGSIPDLRAFASLRELHLAENKLEGLHAASLERISNLEMFDVSYNSIQGTISEAHLSKLDNLKVLNLSYNSLSLDISSDWIPPFQLDSIRLARCEMGPSFPKWILTQHSVSQLDLSSAGIQDLVPEKLWDLSARFEFLNLSDNQFSGTVPDLSSNFLGFPMIDISSNNFSGPIPMIHPNTSAVQLSKNMFQGSVSWICANAYNMLGMLDLSDNRLSGEIPECWTNMTRLYILNLSNNNFSGEIPHGLGFLTNLETLHLRNNDLSGELPSPLRNCVRLRMMDVGENRIKGNVPSWIGTHLVHLAVLSLRQNQFYGSIPPSICQLNEIQVLDLSRNGISGRILHCFNNFSYMVDKEKISDSTLVRHIFGLPDGSSVSYEIGEYIDHALVQWKGQEAVYSRSLGFLKLVVLSSNRLGESIPRETFLLKGLVSVNLSKNHLTGRIDPDIGQMEMLESLDFSSNLLSGDIPSGLASLNYLAVLDLSNNSLSGKIPTGTQLQGFNASAYAGNSGLCGRPLTLCPGDDPQPPITGSINNDDFNGEENGIVTQGFYICMAIGFVIAFWGINVILMFSISWRVAYFNFWSKIGDRLYFLYAKIKLKLRASF